MDVPVPERPLTNAPPTRSLLGAILAVVGLLWQAALLYGFGQFVLLMIGTFQDITASGEADPRVMADGIGQALIPVVVWGVFGSVGLLITLITMVASRYRARWWFWSSWAFAIIYLLFVPIGTVLAITLMVVLVLKRREFRQGVRVASGGGANSVVPAA